MKKRIYYVSRDPAHVEAWLVNAAALPASGFASRQEAVRWASERATEDGAAGYELAQVLVQAAGGEWSCVHDAGSLFEVVDESPPPTRSAAR